MSGRHRRLTRLVAVGVLPAVLAFAVVRALGSGDGGGGGHQAAPPGTMDAGPVGALDMTATLVGTRHSTELAFQVREEQARNGPPQDVRDCRQFAAWAQREGGIVVGWDPVHALSLHARRAVDVNVFSVLPVPVAEVPLTEENGPWVELACRDAAGPLTVPGPVAGSPRADPADDTPHALAAGQRVELLVGPEMAWSDEGKVKAFPSGVVEYHLEVRLGVDEGSETLRLRNGTGPFRCCGRVTFMGFQAARYEWTLSPARTLRYCPELRYADEPPPRTCAPREPG
ncbi:hypothetical protein ACH4T9_17580 [Micromonospora sp. NPDC020750]|uniref:hypothetical protein n=1 Tax=unclassified Micromonospora TaxID=2617518 RepID=UPI0037901C28